jgi:hypothetical protein
MAVINHSHVKYVVRALYTGHSYSPTSLFILARNLTNAVTVVKDIHSNKTLSSMRECTQVNDLSNVLYAVRDFVHRMVSRHIPWFIQTNGHSNACIVISVLNGGIFLTLICVYILGNVHFCAIFVVVVLSRMETVKSMNKHILELSVFKTQHPSGHVYF